jgi:hypothetical protein
MLAGPSGFRLPGLLFQFGHSKFRQLFSSKKQSTSSEKQGSVELYIQLDAGVVSTWVAECWNAAMNWQDVNASTTATLLAWRCCMKLQHHPCCQVHNCRRIFGQNFLATQTARRDHDVHRMPSFSTTWRAFGLARSLTWVMARRENSHHFGFRSIACCCQMCIQACSAESNSPSLRACVLWRDRERRRAAEHLPPVQWWKRE